MRNRIKAVGYFRIDCVNRELALAEADKQIGMVRDYTAANGLTLTGAFVDRYPTRRAPLTQLDEALARCRQAEAMLIIPSLGMLARDSAFFERMSAADCDFVVVDRPQLTPATILSSGMSAFHEDKRANGTERG